MRAASGRRDVPAGGGRGGVARRRRARRHRRELPVHEAGGPRAAGRPAARPSPARHGGGRDRDQRLRRPARGSGRDGGPGGARRAARGARSHLRARAPRPAACGGRSHGRRDRRPGARARGGGIARALMNVGVVGNPSYRDLKSILAHLAQVAPRLGLTLFTEEHIAALWPEPAPAPLHGAEAGQSSADGIAGPPPAGSTAYALSAGGPIVVPGVDAIVVAAICPHTLAVRPLVVPSQASVTVEPIPPWTEDVLVSFDGQVGTTMQAGERLVVKRAEQPVLLVRLGPEGFFARMRKKLQWGDLSDRERK